MSWAPPCSLSSGSSRPLKSKTYYKGIFDARQCLLLSHLIDGQLPLREHPRRPLGSRQRHPLRHRSPSAPSLLEPQVGMTTMLFHKDGKYFQIFNTSRCSFKKIEKNFLIFLDRLPTWHTVHSLAANRNLGILTLAFRFSHFSVYCLDKTSQPTTFLHRSAPSSYFDTILVITTFNKKCCSIGATVYYVYTALSEHQPVYPIANR